MHNQRIKMGVVSGVSAYILWGILPIYWKLIEDARADTILAHRIIWSFIFLLLFIIMTKRFSLFIEESKHVFRHKKKLLLLTLASITISANWLIFIWAVQHDHVVQASLGYYINPLMSVLLGVFVLKEKLSRLQIVSFLLAGTGVAYLTFSYGVFPWVSIVLAASFAIYGLLKKVLNMNAIVSLTLETLFITPIAILYVWMTFGVTIGFNTGSLTTDLLLVLSGVVTAVPLLLFGKAVVNIPLSLTGFLQYIAPTLMLFLGVFLYGEDFTKAHLISFTLIWVSLLLYTSSSVVANKKKQKSIVLKNS